MLSRQAEELSREQDEQLWRAWTEGTPPDLAKAYAGHPGLFTAESIKKLERLRELSREPRDIRALTHLQAHFVGEYLSAELQDVDEALANLEAGLTFQALGNEHPYRELDRLLASTPSAADRQALYNGATAAVLRLNQTLELRDARVLSLLRGLGYTSHEAYGAELRQVDLSRLGLLAEEILERTRPAYLVVMDALARRELSVPFADVRRCDLPRLFRPRALDPLFPKEKLLLRAEETLGGIGIRLGDLPNLRIDMKERSGKNPRPLAIAPAVPGDVRLSYSSVEGIRAQAVLLHEIGHALHFAFTRERRFELAKLGGRAQAEAFAYAFEDLAVDPVWLEEHAGLRGEELAAHLYEASAHRLLALRRAAGDLLYQLELHRREGQDARELYRAIVERTYAVRMTDDDVARYLADSSDFYASADDLRGWFLAAQIQGQLKSRFGPRWWGSPEAGRFLESLWAHGNALNARELALEMGEDGVRPDVLLLRLATTLKVPIKINARFASEAEPPPALTPAR
jgi:hypothetical protein